MKISVNKEDEHKSRISVSGSLSVESAGQLHEVLSDELKGNKSVSLDLSKVSEVDVAGLQLLCSAHKSARTSGGDLCLDGATDDFLDRIDRSGFIHHKGCSEEFEPCLWSRQDGQ